MAVGPNFICVGMPKSGTTWLYDQLRNHPHFWMPPIKELHFLDVPPGQRADHFQRQWYGLDDDRIHQLQSFAAAADAAEGFQQYAQLFVEKEWRLAGDVTPRYCILEEEAIDALHDACPALRILLMLRDPVDRLWSAVGAHIEQIPNWQDPLLRPLLWSLALQDPELKKYPAATEVYRRWRKRFPVMLIFYETLKSNPAAVRRRVLRFLGAAAELDYQFQLPPTYNRNRGSRLPLPESDRALLALHYASELADGAVLFNGPAARWARRHEMPGRAKADERRSNSK